MRLKVSNEVRAGILLVVAIALLVWGYHFLKGRNFLSKQNLYYAVYERVDGLEESSPVFLNGLQIGIVQEVRFHPDSLGWVIVSFSVENDFPIADSSVAEIFSSDLMGTKSIRLLLSKSKIKHKTGDTLISSIEADLKAQVSAQMLPIKKKAEDLMMSIDSVMSVIQNIFNENTRENLSKTFASIKATIENLEHTSIVLDTLMANEKYVLTRIFANIESITNNLKNNNDLLSNIINNMSAFSDSLASSDIKKTIMNANHALSQANDIIGKINRGEGSLGLLVHNDSLYRNLESASRNLDMLMKDLKENPKRYVHFSLFDFGKTVIVDEDGNKVKPNNGNNGTTSDLPVRYKLQIKSARKKIPAGSKEFKEVKDVEEHYIDGWYKYTVGDFTDINDVTSFQMLMKENFPDAFIVAFRGSRQVSVPVYTSTSGM